MLQQLTCEELIDIRFTASDSPAIERRDPDDWLPLLAIPLSALRIEEEPCARASAEQLN
ncbi:MAG: hypothetical protein ACXVKA_12860 [Acidimicrobiia bacterium]